MPTTVVRVAVATVLKVLLVVVVAVLVVAVPVARTMSSCKLYFREVQSGSTIGKYRGKWESGEVGKWGSGEVGSGEASRHETPFLPE